MADESRDAGKSKTGAEKKQPETVLLTAEELRAIAGGAAGSFTSRPHQRHQVQLLKTPSPSRDARSDGAIAPVESLPRAGSIGI